MNTTRINEITSQINLEFRGQSPSAVRIVNAMTMQIAENNLNAHEVVSAFGLTAMNDECADIAAKMLIVDVMVNGFGAFDLQTMLEKIATKLAKIKKTTLVGMQISDVSILVEDSEAEIVPEVAEEKTVGKRGRQRDERGYQLARDFFYANLGTIVVQKQMIDSMREHLIANEVNTNPLAWFYSFKEESGSEFTLLPRGRKPKQIVEQI